MVAALGVNRVYSAPVKLREAINGGVSRELLVVKTCRLGTRQLHGWSPTLIADPQPSWQELLFMPPMRPPLGCA